MQYLKFNVILVVLACVVSQARLVTVNADQTIPEEARLAWDALEAKKGFNHFESELTLTSGDGAKQNTRKQNVVADRLGNNKMLRLQSYLIKDPNPPESVFVINSSAPFTARRSEAGSDYTIEAIGSFGMSPEGGEQAFGGKIYHISHRFNDTPITNIINGPTFKLKRVSKPVNGLVQIDFAIGDKIINECTIICDSGMGWRIVETRLTITGMKSPDITKISYEKSGDEFLPAKVEIIGATQQMLFDHIKWSNNKTSESDYTPVAFGIQADYSQPVGNKSRLNKKTWFIISVALLVGASVIVRRRK